MNYDVVLLEKPYEDGLTRNEIRALSDLITNGDDNKEVFPIEVQGRMSSVAMGFITIEAAEKLDYDYDASGLNDAIISIIDENENTDLGIVCFENYFLFKGIKIYLDR